MSPQERIKILQEAPKNSWVAFSEDETEVVAHGSTYDEAVANAEKKGVKELVLVKTPEEWLEMVFAD